MHRVFWLFLVSILLAGCSQQASFNAPGAVQEPIFVPPILAPTSSQSPINFPTSSVGESLQPTPTLPCTAVLSFIEDLSIPDGSQVAPNASLDKRWSVRNNGTCNWGEEYTLRLVSGSEMGAAPEQALVPARSGTDTVIRIQFTAPADPGTYTSAWQAFTPVGQPFGDQFFINIVVTQP